MPLTPDAIPTNEQLVESLADRFYHPHKKAIWGTVVVFAVALCAFLYWAKVFVPGRLDDMWGRYHDAAGMFAWPNPMSPYAPPDTAAARRQMEALQVLVRDYPEEKVAPFAMTLIAKDQYVLGDFENAKKTLEVLRSKFKDFSLNVLPAEPSASGQARPLVEKFEAAIDREKQWSVRHAYEHHWPGEDRLALVETSLGSFWLGFYFDKAPAHSESFIRHAKAGDYNGTQVFEVIQGVEGQPERFSAGSKFSGLPDKGGLRDPADHDRDEPTDTIEPEDSRHTVHHLYRVVSAAPMDSGESSSRFIVVTKRDGVQKMDGQYTPFAAVMDREQSLKTIDAIGRASTYGSNPSTKDSEGTYRMRDHPYPPVYIRRVTIWSKEKLEGDHTWDTKRAEEAKNEPEPWEKDLPPAPKPEDFIEKPKDPAVKDKPEQEDPKKDK